MTRLARLLSVAAVVFLFAGALVPAQVGRLSRAVGFRSRDGSPIAGLYFEAAQRPAAAVVLVPMLGRPKEDWLALGERLADANITALAIDLPGQTLPADAAALTAWHTAVIGAVDYLFNRADVRGGAAGVAGASLGANLAAVAAAGDSRIRSLALISPSLDYRGVRIEAPLRQFGARPVLLLASLKDPYAARSVRELAMDPPGLREVYWSETVAHGTMLLAREPDLLRVVVEWFQRTLG
jgi:alpha-beta hydrolase superfamily lysophospholipase